MGKTVFSNLASSVLEQILELEEKGQLQMNIIWEASGVIYNGLSWGPAAEARASSTQQLRGRKNR